MDTTRPTLLDRLAARDGGRFCFYCAAALTCGDNSCRICRRPSPGRRGTWTPAVGYRFAVADHVTARAAGGPDRIANRVLSCAECNSAKGADAVLLFVARGCLSRRRWRVLHAR